MLDGDAAVRNVFVLLRARRGLDDRGIHFGSFATFRG